MIKDEENVEALGMRPSIQTVYRRLKTAHGIADCFNAWAQDGGAEVNGCEGSNSIEQARREQAQPVDRHPRERYRFQVHHPAAPTASTSPRRGPTQPPPNVCLSCRV